MEAVAVQVPAGLALEAFREEGLGSTLLSSARCYEIVLGDDDLIRLPFSDEVVRKLAHSLYRRLVPPPLEWVPHMKDYVRHCARPARAEPAHGGNDTTALHEIAVNVVANYLNLDAPRSQWLGHAQTTFQFSSDSAAREAFHRYAKYTTLHGLKWAETPPYGSVQGMELVNERLQQALLLSGQFTDTEWRSFGVDELSVDHYVTVRGRTFRPIPFSPLEVVRFIQEKASKRAMLSFGILGESLPSYSAIPEDSFGLLRQVREDGMCMASSHWKTLYECIQEDVGLGVIISLERAARLFVHHRRADCVFSSNVVAQMHHSAVVLTIVFHHWHAAEPHPRFVTHKSSGWLIEFVPMAPFGGTLHLRRENFWPLPSDHSRPWWISDESLIVPGCEEYKEGLSLAPKWKRELQRESKTDNKIQKQAIVSHRLVCEGHVDCPRLGDILFPPEEVCTGHMIRASRVFTMKDAETCGLVNIFSDTSTDARQKLKEVFVYGNECVYKVVKSSGGQLVGAFVIAIFDAVFRHTRGTAALVDLFAVAHSMRREGWGTKTFHVLRKIVVSCAKIHEKRTYVIFAETLVREDAQKFWMDRLDQSSVAGVLVLDAIDRFNARIPCKKNKYCMLDNCIPKARIFEDGDVLDEE